MKHLVAPLGVVLSLAGCAQIAALRQPQPPEPSPAARTPPAVQATGTVRPPATARTVDEFDTTTEAQKAAAQDTAGAAGRSLGRTIASLGAPAEPGFWLKTPLVDARASGRIEDPATGKSVRVDLIPIEGAPGAGSRISLAAMRALDLDLTGLPEIAVFRGDG